MTTSHSHRFPGYAAHDICETCGRSRDEVRAEREARWASRNTDRPANTEALELANQRERQIRNESRRDRRRFHGGN